MDVIRYFALDTCRRRGNRSTRRNDNTYVGDGVHEGWWLMILFHTYGQNVIPSARGRFVIITEIVIVCFPVDVVNLRLAVMGKQKRLYADDGNKTCL